MATIKAGDSEIHSIGELPEIGSMAPDFKLVKPDLSEVTLADYSGGKLIINIYPSVDTGTCALSTTRFNQEASKLSNTKIICVSKDLPFALGRYCAAEGISNLDTLSSYRDGGAFGRDYGVELVDGMIKGLNARAVVIIDEEGKVIYTQLVPIISNEPNYDDVLAAI
jgi:thiol peroxidase